MLVNNASKAVKSKETAINQRETQICYKMTELMNYQSRFLTINWSNYQEIPYSLRFINRGVNNKKFMENVVAMFMRKSSNPWLAASHSGKAPIEKKEKLTKKLTGVLNKMAPEKFTKIAKMTMDIVNEFAATKDIMEIIIGLILQFGIKQSVFSSQYAELCSHLHSHLPKLAMISGYQWVIYDPDVSDTFRKMIIQQSNALFIKHRVCDHDKEVTMDTDPEMMELRKTKEKDNFFAIMVLVAELYNVELIKQKVIYKGIFDVLLPPQNIKLTEIDIEGLCRLFKRCGKKLDEQGMRGVDKYLQKLIEYAQKFDFRTKILVDQIKEMRENEWKHRLKQQTAKTKDEIRNEFEKEQSVERGKKNKKRKKYDCSNLVNNSNPIPSKSICKNDEPPIILRIYKQPQIQKDKTRNEQKEIIQPGKNEKSQKYDDDDDDKKYDYDGCHRYNENDSYYDHSRLMQKRNEELETDENMFEITPINSSICHQLFGRPSNKHKYNRNRFKINTKFRRHKQKEDKSISLHPNYAGKPMKEYKVKNYGDFIDDELPYTPDSIDEELETDGNMFEVTAANNGGKRDIALKCNCSFKKRDKEHKVKNYGDFIDDKLPYTPDSIDES